MDQYRILIFEIRAVIRLIPIVMVSSFITILISACTIVDDSQVTVNEYAIDKSEHFIAENITFYALTSCDSENGDTSNRTSDSGLPSFDNRIVAHTTIIAQETGDSYESQDKDAPNIEKYIINGYYSIEYNVVSIFICFPQLHGVRDESLEALVNDLIYNTVITQDETIWTESRYFVDINYEITHFSENYISMVFSGTKTDFHNNSFREGLTIDLRTGERVHLSDFYSPDEILAIMDRLVLTEHCMIIDYFWGNQQDTKSFIVELCQERINNDRDHFFKRGFYLHGDLLGLIVSVTDPEHASVEFNVSSAPWA